MNFLFQSRMKLSFLSFLIGWIFVVTLSLVSLVAEAKVSNEVMGRIGNFPYEPYTPLGETFELRNRQVENQQQSEECYLFAYTNYLQVANANHFGQSSIGISGPYLMTVKLIEYIEETFQKGESRLHLAGGNIPDGFALTAKYGLIPDQVWNPEIPFYLWPFESLYLDIDLSIQHHQKILDSLSSQHGDRSQVYQNALRLAREETLNHIFKLTGPLPTRFSWQNREWTPRQFAARYGIKQANRIELYHPMKVPLYDDESNLRDLIQTSMGSQKSHFLIRQRDWDVIENEMLKALNQGVPVLVGVYWARTSHVMIAVGYEMRNGRVYAWKFLNSWGRFTPNGEAFYRASDFRNKADQIWIIR